MHAGGAAREPLAWQNEDTGEMRRVITAYLEGSNLDPVQVETLRWYFKQWIDWPDWRDPSPNGETLDVLRRSVNFLRTLRDFRTWHKTAIRIGIDPI